MKYYRVDDIDESDWLLAEDLMSASILIAKTYQLDKYELNVACMVESFPIITITGTNKHQTEYELYIREYDISNLPCWINK